MVPSIKKMTIKSCMFWGAWLPWDEFDWRARITGGGRASAFFQRRWLCGECWSPKLKHNLVLEFNFISYVDVFWSNTNFNPNTACLHRLSRRHCLWFWNTNIFIVFKPIWSQLWHPAIPVRFICYFYNMHFSSIPIYTNLAFTCYPFPWKVVKQTG